jgi:hypothetical protein
MVKQYGTFVRLHEGVIANKTGVIYRTTRIVTSFRNKQQGIANRCALHTSLAARVELKRKPTKLVSLLLEENQLSIART